MPVDARTAIVAAWPRSSVLPPLGAFATAPAAVRSHVRVILSAWGMGEFEEIASLVASEFATNALRASRGFDGRPIYGDGRRLVICFRMFTDGTRLRLEAWDQAPGEPALRQPGIDAESGRGLLTVDRITLGAWGWHPAARRPGKCVWAELSQAALEES